MTANALILTDAETEWFRDECVVCLGNGCRKCEAVRDEVDRIVRERMAQAWDEAAEATVEWVAATGRPGPNGPVDPPRNPYETTGGAS